MHNLERLTPSALWRYVPQLFVGLFFLSAAFLKSYQAFFGPNRYSLGQIFEAWISQKSGFGFYLSFMEWTLPYADILAIVVIGCQAIGGFLLVLNYRTRLASMLLLFIQLNIYFAIYHQSELRNLNAEALWLLLFYFARPEMTGKLWKLATYAFVLLLLSYLFVRAKYFGDASPQSFQWQYEIFTYTNMSSWPALKTFVVSVFSGENAALLWAASWWIKITLAFGMLTRYRLYAGAALLIYMFGVTLVWLSTIGCDGVFWVLILYVWVTHEREMQQTSGSDPLMTLLP